MDNKTLIIGGVVVAGLIYWWYYQKNASKIADQSLAYASNPVAQVNQGKADATNAILATGSAAASGIISAIGGSLINAINQPGNSSGIYFPQDEYSMSNGGYNLNY